MTSWRILVNNTHITLDNKLDFPQMQSVCLQWRCQNFAPGAEAKGAGSEVRGDKVTQKWKPSGVRSAKTNMAEVFFATACAYLSAELARS